VTKQPESYGQRLESYRNYLRDHPDDFRTDTRISFRHIYLDPQRRGAALAADAAQLRARLNAAGDRSQAPDLAALSELGDATLLERQFTALPLGTAAQLFGDAFAEALRTLEPGQWSAPIVSAYGEHLVYVSDIAPGTVPALEQVRAAVRRDWVNARRTELLDAFYAALLQRYRVTVVMPPSKADDDQLAELH
jgi:parvulin-like peptidyl-prolyl isomerase